MPNKIIVELNADDLYHLDEVMTAVHEVENDDNWPMGYHTDVEKSKELINGWLDKMQGDAKPEFELNGLVATALWAAVSRYEEDGKPELANALKLLWDHLETKLDLRIDGTLLTQREAEALEVAQMAIGVAQPVMPKDVQEQASDCKSVLEWLRRRAVVVDPVDAAYQQLAQHGTFAVVVADRQYLFGDQSTEIGADSATIQAVVDNVAEAMSGDERLYSYMFELKHRVVEHLTGVTKSP